MSDLAAALFVVGSLLQVLGVWRLGVLVRWGLRRLGRERRLAAAPRRGLARGRRAA